MSGSTVISSSAASLSIPGAQALAGLNWCVNIQLQNKESELPHSAAQSSILFGVAAVQTCHLQGHAPPAGVATLRAMEMPRLAAVTKIPAMCNTRQISSPILTGDDTPQQQATWHPRNLPRPSHYCTKPHLIFI